VNIDERLEKLTERHEALTQTVELLAKETTELGKKMSGLEGFVRDIAEATARLLHIAQIPEHRITRLEEEGSAD
jgi:archaellum component FlaC